MKKRCNYGLEEECGDEVCWRNGQFGYEGGSEVEDWSDGAVGKARRSWREVGQEAVVK